MDEHSPSRDSRVLWVVRACARRGVGGLLALGLTLHCPDALGQAPAPDDEESALEPQAGDDNPEEPDVADAPETDDARDDVAAPDEDISPNPAEEDESAAGAGPGASDVPLEDEVQPTVEREPTIRESLLPEIHGFVSQGFIKSTNNNYLAQSERGSFEFTEVGLNFTKQISERFRVGMQLFMRDLGPLGNYKPQFDWFYLDYSFFDWLGIRAGRSKIPFGLYNEINDVDAARVPILLPQSVYPTDSRDFLLAQTGAELYGRVPLSVLGDLEYRGYGGTIFLDASDSDTVSNFEVPYVVGGRLMWETPLDDLRVGGTVQALSLDGEYVLTQEMLQAFQDSGVLPADSNGQALFRIPATLWVASLEYTIHDFLFAAEYGRWYVKIRSDEPDVVPPSETTSERFYVMASYRVASWFAPGAYYSVLYPDATNREGRALQQHDVALTMRFDVTDHWLFKLEGHYMGGTADLDPDLNGGTPRTDLAPTWGLLLAKTTAYF